VPDKTKGDRDLLVSNL